MSLRSVFVCVFLFYGVFGKRKSGADRPKALNIWCLEDDIKTQKGLLKGIKNISLCTAKPLAVYPFTFENTTKTPAAPERIDSEIEVYETSDSVPTKQVAVIVSWDYRKDFFDDVESYHIELNFVYPPSGSYRQYIITWGDALREVISKSRTRYLRFHFIYAGRPDNYHITPENEYRFRIMPMPLYGENENAQDVSKFLTIPNCTNKHMKKTQYCSTRPCPGQKFRLAGRCTRNKKQTTPATPSTTLPPEKMPEELDDDMTIHVILIAVGGLLILALLAGLIIWFCRRHSNERDTIAQDRIRLLLVCTTDNGFLGAINQFISMLLKIPNVDVVCNLRQKTEIGTKGIQDWTKNEIEQSDIICFAVANPHEVVKQEESEETENSRLDDVEKHQVAIVMRAAETIVVNKTPENAGKKFATLDLSDCIKKDASPYFKQFKLPGDLKKFLKYAIGNSNATRLENFVKEKTIFINLLTNAQLGYSHTMGCLEEDEKIICNANEDSPLQVANDLNELPEKLHEKLYEFDAENNFSLNIPASGPASCESNASQTYSTTDFNVEDEVGTNRFIQAGARPKQPSC